MVLCLEEMEPYICVFPAKGIVRKSGIMLLGSLLWLVQNFLSYIYSFLLTKDIIYGWQLLVGWFVGLIRLTLALTKEEKICYVFTKWFQLGLAKWVACQIYVQLNESLWNLMLLIYLFILNVSPRLWHDYEMDVYKYESCSFFFSG